MKHFEVPAGVERDTVVGQHQLPLLDIRKTVERNDGNFRQCQLAGSRQPAVTRDDGALLADQNRICEPERPDAAGDLSDLRVAMRTGITRRRD